jgi:hypothetical protein
MIIALTVLAIARVTRLITTDHVFDTQRDWVLSHVMREGREEPAWRVLLAYLIFCPWCMSMYVAAPVACAYAVWGETMPYMTVVLALAASHVTGFLASKEGEG